MAKSGRRKVAETVSQSIPGEYANTIILSQNLSSDLESSYLYQMVTNSNHTVVAYSVGFSKDIFVGNKCNCLENKVFLATWRKSHQIPDRGEKKWIWKKMTFLWRGKLARRGNKKIE